MIVKYIVNNEAVEFDDLKKFTIDNQIVNRIIKKAADRLKKEEEVNQNMD